MATEDRGLLSAAELKRQLYAQMASAGALDSVKLQMRSKLLAHLQQREPSLLERRGAEAAAPAADAPWRRLANSLVAEYLAAGKFTFTLSVFKASAPRRDARRALRAAPVRLAQRGIHRLVDLVRVVKTRGDGQAGEGGEFILHHIQKTGRAVAVGTKAQVIGQHQQPARLRC